MNTCTCNREQFPSMQKKIYMFYKNFIFLIGNCSVYLSNINPKYGGMVWWFVVITVYWNANVEVLHLL